MNLKLANASNMVFIYPLVIAILGNLYIGIILSGGLFISSFLYHNSHEQKHYPFDVIFSWLNIIYNLYLCYLFKFHILPFGLAFIFLILGLYSYFFNTRKNYDTMHSVWHISCAVITTCCYLGYLLYR